MSLNQIHYTLAKISTLIGAQLQGDPECVITGVASLDEATTGQLSFLDNPRYRKHLATTNAAAIILSPSELAGCAINALVMENPYFGYAKAAALFEQRPAVVPGIHPSAVIGADCKIDASVSIGPFCSIGAGVVIEKGAVIGPHCVIGDRVHIGSDSHLWANVTLYHAVIIGARAIIHSGVVIGSDGFGFANDKGVWHKIPQLGTVRIGNDVEIGANTTIDRGALNDTVIGNNVKLDNQVQIGHNVRIGDHTAVAGCVGIAGSTTVGKYCLIGGGSCINGHIDITDQVIITGMTGISHSISEPGVYSSAAPMQLNREWRKNSVRMRHLDDMARRLQKLEKLILNKDKSD